MHGPDNKSMILAPGSFGANACWTRYLSGHHVLLAHAKAYHIYKNEFKSRQKGKIFQAILSDYFTGGRISLFSYSWTGDDPNKPQS
jgi:hypothetical protein